MSDRGPDSAGLALYSANINFDIKVTLKFEESSVLQELRSLLNKNLNGKFSIVTRANHAVVNFFNYDYAIVLSIVGKFSDSLNVAEDLPHPLRSFALV